MKFSGTVTLQYETPFSPFSPEEYKQGLDWLEKSGFDGAELCISNYVGLDIPKIQKELEQRHLGCSTLSTGQARSLESISLLHDGDTLKRAQNRLLQHINTAALLGSKVTLGLLRGIGTPQTQKQDLYFLSKNLEPIIDYACQKHVTIILEALNRYETALLNNAEAVMDFIEKDLGNAECMGVLWDIFHANIEDVNLEAAIGRMGKRLGHVHMADSNRMFPGYGHIDFEAITKKLASIGFSGYMSFECFNQPSRSVVLNEAGPFINKLRSIAANS